MWSLMVLISFLKVCLDLFKVNCYFSTNYNNHYLGSTKGIVIIFPGVLSKSKESSYLFGPNESSLFQCFRARWKAKTACPSTDGWPIEPLWRLWSRTGSKFVWKNASEKAHLPTHMQYFDVFWYILMYFVWFASLKHNGWLSGFLYEWFCEVQKLWTHWISRMIDAGFVFCSSPSKFEENMDCKKQMKWHHQKFQTHVLQIATWMKRMHRERPNFEAGGRVRGFSLEGTWLGDSSKILVDHERTNVLPLEAVDVKDPATWQKQLGRFSL